MATASSPPISSDDLIPRTYRVPYFLYRHLLRASFGLLTRWHLSGVENVPLAGRCILTSNHLTMLDPPLTYASSPRWMYGLAAAKYQRKHVIGLTAVVGRCVFVRRGEFDRRSLSQCLAILNGDNPLYVPIEGTRSKTNALLEGKSGVAYLATRTNAPIVPVAIWGIEQVLPNLRRGRRVDVYIQFGEAIHLPEGRARGKQLDDYTEDIMTTLATMLPEDYRGVYAEHPGTLQKLATSH